MEKRVPEAMIRTSILPLLLGLLLMAGCDTTPTDPSGPTRRIAVYNGSGANSEFATAVKNALEADGRVVDLVDEGQVQSSLSDYGLVIISAGNPIDISDALGFTGRERIHGLVNAGGGFIGLGGGAYLVGDSISYQGSGSITPGIEFYRGLSKGPIASLASSGHVLTGVTITDVEFDPASGTSFQTMYFEGPEFLVDESLPAITIARYNANNLIAAMGFESGPGRVAACSFNPEIEENDDRDGTSFGSDLVDPESEWFFLQTLVAYCFRESLI